MHKTGNPGSGIPICRAVLIPILLCTLSSTAAAQTSGNRVTPIPNLSGIWGKFDEFLAPPASGPGPVMNMVTGGAYYRGDYRNPILQPWVADILRKSVEADIAGKSPSPAATSSCLPGGVPGVFARRGSLDVVQTPALVLLLFNNDAQVRHVYMNQPHSKKLIPSWFGESVGHYEGDTMVVDTIGLSVKSVLDVFGTPHTDRLHVVERFHLVDDANAFEGKALRVDIKVEDPGAFTTPFNEVAYFLKDKPESRRGSFEEAPCAENNRSVGVAPVPEAEKPDF